MKSEFFSKYRPQLLALAFVLFLVAGFAMIGLLASQPHDHLQTHESDSVVSESSSSEPKPLVLAEPLVGLKAKDQETPFEGKEGELKLRSVGDVLLHEFVSEMASVKNPFYKSAVDRLHKDGISWENPGGAYDFYPMLAQIAPYMSYADVTLANMEVIVANPQYPVTGYPSFNAPKQILKALQSIGVDMVTNGTNHTLDYSARGALASIANLKEAQMPYVGSFESQEDHDTPRIIEKNGIKIGILTYSYGTNGVPVPEDQPYLINLVDLPQMVEDVKALKDKVDAVVVTLQLGQEYDTTPDPTQEQVFQALSDAGVKLILGGHPHVLQPMQWFNGKQTFAIYSQASFMSGQIYPANKQGGITEVTFKRGEDGQVTVTDPKFMPIYITGAENAEFYETVPMADYNRYAVTEGADWYEIIRQRMQLYTKDFRYVSHLETQWTQEDTDIHR